MIFKIQWIYKCIKGILKFHKIWLPSSGYIKTLLHIEFKRAIGSVCLLHWVSHLWCFTGNLVFLDWICAPSVNIAKNLLFSLNEFAISFCRKLWHIPVLKYSDMSSFWHFQKIRPNFWHFLVLKDSDIFQFWRFPVLMDSDIFPILTSSDSDIFRFWRFQILTFSGFDKKWIMTFSDSDMFSAPEVARYPNSLKDFLFGNRVWISWSSITPNGRSSLRRLAWVIWSHNLKRHGVETRRYIWHK